MMSRVFMGRVWGFGLTCEFTCNTNKFKLLAMQVNRKYADPSICLIKWRAESRLWGVGVRKLAGEWQL